MGALALGSARPLVNTTRVPSGNVMFGRGSLSPASAHASGRILGAVSGGSGAALRRRREYVGRIADLHVTYPLILNAGHGLSGYVEIGDGYSAITAEAVRLYSDPEARQQMMDQSKQNEVRYSKMIDAVEELGLNSNSRHPLVAEALALGQQVQLATEVERYGMLVEMFNSPENQVAELYLLNFEVGRNEEMMQQMANDLGVTIAAHKDDVSLARMSPDSEGSEFGLTLTAPPDCSGSARRVSPVNAERLPDVTAPGRTEHFVSNAE